VWERQCTVQGDDFLLPEKAGGMKARPFPLIVGAVLVFLFAMAFVLSPGKPKIELRIVRYATNEQGARLYTVLELVNRTDLPVSYWADSQVHLETPTGSLAPRPELGGRTGPLPSIEPEATVRFRYYVGSGEGQVVFRTYDVPMRVRAVRKLPSWIFNRLPAKCWLPREQVFRLKL
jgi:hypothetical protein